MGAAAVKAESFVKKAKSYEKKREPIPKVAATEPKAKKMMLEVRRTFLAKYRACLEMWRKGERLVLFPEGTWWMARFHHAPVDVPYLGYLEAG